MQACFLLKIRISHAREGITVHIRTATFSEVNQHAESLLHWPQEYDQVTPGRFRGFLQDIHFDAIRLFRERMNQGVAQHTHTPAGQVSLIIPIHLQCERTSDSARCVLSAGVTLLPTDQDFFFVAPPQTDYAVLAVSQEQLRDRLSGDDYSGLLQAHRSYGIRIRPDVLAGCRQQLLQLMQAVTQPDKLHGSQALREKALQDQLILLLLELSTPAARQPPKPLGNQHHYIVRRCHDYVLSQEGAIASVLDVCRELNVPQRTLNYSFARVTGTSPAQYLRAVKLNAARRQLQSSALPVTAIAANFGFFHTGYFSQEYRRLFAETPTDTRGRQAS